MTHHVSSNIQDTGRCLHDGVLGTSLWRTGICFPPMTVTWSGVSGAACTLLGSADAPSGLHCGVTPGSSNGTFYSWGPWRQHFGADNSLYQGCTPSWTALPYRYGACYMSDCLSPKEGITGESSSIFLQYYTHLLHIFELPESVIQEYHIHFLIPLDYRYYYYYHNGCLAEKQLWCCHWLMNCNIDYIPWYHNTRYCICSINCIGNDANFVVVSHQS